MYIRLRLKTSEDTNHQMFSLVSSQGILRQLAMKLSVRMISFCFAYTTLNFTSLFPHGQLVVPTFAFEYNQARRFHQAVCDPLENSPNRGGKAGRKSRLTSIVENMLYRSDVTLRFNGAMQTVQSFQIREITRPDNIAEVCSRNI